MTKKIQQAVQFVRKKMQDLKKSNKNNELSIKVNNKDAQKQITQIQKEIESLQEKISSRQLKLNVTNESLDKIRADTNQSVIDQMPEAGNKAIKNETYSRLDNDVTYKALIKDSDKLNNEIIKYNTLLESAKNKMAQLGSQTNQTSVSQNKLSNFAKNFKGKLEQAKISTSGLKSSFNKIPKVTQNITNNIKGMVTGLKGGIGNVLKIAGALFGLQTIYSTLRSAASSWLSSQNSQARQLSANIDYMKYALGSTLAPVIQWIVNLIYQALKGVQSLIYALTGVNIFANASAKAYSNMAGSAKKAKEETKQLAGIHDEINNIQDSNNSDSGGGTGDVTPNIDLGNIDGKLMSWAEKVKGVLSKLFEPMKNAWDTHGQALMDSIKNSATKIKELFVAVGKSFEEVWLNGTGEQTINLILQILTSVFNTISNISTAYKNAWENNGGTEIIQNIWNALNNVLEIVLGVKQAFEEWTASQSFQDYANSIIGIWNTLTYWLDLITQKLKEVWENGGKEAFTKLLETISKLEQAIDVILKVLTPVVEYVLGIVTPIITGVIKSIGFLLDAIGGILDFIIGVFTGDWDKAWTGIKEIFEGVWNAVKALIDANLESIKFVWDTVWGAMRDTITNIWNNISSTISNVWNTIVTKVKEGVSGAWNAITSVFGNVSNWFGDKFSQAWQAVKNVFSTGGAIFEGIKDGILNGLKTIVNAIIRGINKVISIPFNGINSALRTIRNTNIMGISPFSWISTISVPEIPQLAKGGVLYDETAFIGGEYSGARSNPEIVSPKKLMYETMVEAISDSNFSMGNKGQPIRVQLIVGTKMFIDEVVDGINEKTRRTGKAVIKVGD